LHQTPLGILKVHYSDSKTKRKKKEKDKVLIYITIVLKQLKKIKYPKEKKERRKIKLCFALLACRVFFWWLNFATGQQQKNEHGKGPKDSSKKKNYSKLFSNLPYLDICY